MRFGEEPSCCREQVNAPDLEIGSVPGFLLLLACGSTRWTKEGDCAAMTKWAWSESEGGWLAQSHDKDISLVVGGMGEQADVDLSAAATALVGEVDQLRAEIADYLAGHSVQMGGDHLLPLVIHPQSPLVDIIQIELRESGRPEAAHVFVVTGHPDPYYLYDVSLSGRVIVGVVGGFW